MNYKMKELFAIRLKRARIMAGFSMDMLAQSVGVSKEAINKYEKGKAQPDSTKLLKICKALGVKVDYFFRVEKYSIDEIEFRKKAKLGAREINQLEEIVKDKLERYLELEELMAITNDFVNPLSSKVVDNAEAIEVVADELRSAWGLGNNPIGNIIDMLEDSGVKVIEIDMPDSFDGLATMVNDSIPIIVINKNFPIERKRFTLIHELGHLLLEFPKDMSSKEKEKLCNRFAGAFLLPQYWVFKELGNSRKHFYIEELSALQKEWGLSIQAILYRCKDHGIIKQFAMTTFYKKYNADPGYKERIDKSRFLGSETSGRFNQLVFKALAQEVISTGKAAALTNMSISEVKSIMPVL